MKLTVKVVSVLTLMIVIIFVPAILVLWHNQQKTIIEQARIRALTLYQMITVTRQWVAENRDRIEPVPAVATKELSQYANYMADFRFHITSDRLINPENAPDEFEIKAISYIRKGLKEYSEIYYSEEHGKVFRYAAPLFINDSCLNCHFYQGYKVGEFRGLISVDVPLKDLELSIYKSNSALVATLFIGLSGIIIAVSILLYRMVLRPLSSLTEAAGKIREGDYSMRTNIRTDDEIQELSEAFDVMSHQIAENEETLIAKLDEAVQKYVDLVDELKDTNAKLGTLNQLKTDLLDSIAHEIRTPLTKIMSYSELMNDPRLSGDIDSQAKFREALKRNVTSMTAMFNDIITLSRLEHDQHKFHKIPVHFNELVQSVLYVHEQEIADKSLKILIDIPENTSITADAETFSYAVSNIISNAIKYSHKKGTIELKAALEDETFTFSCKDEGIGIPEEDIASVTRRFYRSSNVKKEYPGTGLGLSIASQVVKAHGGTLSINSEVNKFTQIIISMPQRKTEEPEETDDL